jgi:PAS domain S-box-containing protein
MDTRQHKALKSWVENLKGKNQTLRERLAALRKENQVLQKALRDSRKLLSDTPGAVVLVKEEKIVFTNKNAWKRLGYTQEEILGQHFLNFVHPDSVGYVSIIHQRRISDKSVPDQYETYLMTKTGETMFCEVRVKKIRYQGRRAFLLHLVDLDQKRQREKQLVRSQKSEAIVRMGLGLSGEFRQCLSALKENPLFLDNIESLGEAKIAESLRSIEAIAEKGDLIAHQLDCLARVERQKSDLVLFDLRKVVKEAISKTRPNWDGATARGGGKIHLKTYLRTVSPVEGDPKEIKDALTSIISNAVDALSDGGEIYLTMEESSGLAHVYVQDNGSGIRDDIKDKIFDPFFTTRGGARPGLGLSLAYAIINRHGGEIEVMSKEGRGATFIIKLPLARKASSSKRRGAKKRVKDSHTLIIGDEGVVKDLLSHIFVSKGGKVTSVSTGMEGLKSLKKNKFDLVIADQNTPYLELSKIIARIKKIDRALPIALVNADEEKGKSVYSLKALGADLVIGKPLDADRILSLVSKALAL